MRRFEKKIQTGKTSATLAIETSPGTMPDERIIRYKVGARVIARGSERGNLADIRPELDWIVRRDRPELAEHFSTSEGWEEVE